MAQINFNAAQVAPDTGRPEPIPSGWYNMIITASEMKPTKDNMGALLELKLKVIDGQHANHVVYDRMNLQNANATTVEIAYKRLSAYCHATGVINLQETGHLHDIPMKIKVKLTPPKGQYEADNEVSAVKGFNDPSAGVVGAAGAAPGAAIAPPAQQPWQQPQQPAQQAQQQQPWQQPQQQQPVQPPQQQQAQQPVQQQPWQQPQQQQQPMQQAQQPAPAAAAGSAVPPWVQQS